MKLLLAGYIYPSDDPSSQEAQAWTTIFAHAAHIWGIIVNPNSGPGPTPPDPNYVALFKKLKTTNMKIFGYVATDYGNKDIRKCKEELEFWETRWGISNIFFDEAAGSEEMLPYYATLRCYHTGMSILNPGALPDSRYLRVGDIITTIETTFDTYSQRTFAPWELKNRNQLCHMVLGCPINSISPVIWKSRLAAEYIFITDKVEPEAYQELPSYFTRLIGKLA